MLQNIKQILGRNYTPLNLIEISKDNILKNYKYFSKINSKIAIAPVLKSNAYGHGITKVAKILEKTKAPFFCADSLYEAYELQKARIKKPVLIMGYIEPSNLKIKPLPFKYAVSTFDQLEAINKYQQGAKVHLKIDTGMHRLGIPVSDLADFLKKAKKCQQIKIEGLMSHFASADSMNTTTKRQIASFEKANSILKSFGINPAWQHISATDGMLNLDTNKLSQISNLARVGLGIYGIDLSRNYSSLKPTLELQSKIVQIKTLQKGESVGYSSTFTAKKKMVIGVLPIGYNDGVDRRLSNVGKVKIGDKFCQIIGMVSMNITTIDLSPIKKPYVGQKVVVYSNNINDSNSIQKAAKICQTIPYDLLIHLSPTSIRREILTNP